MSSETIVWISGATEGIGSGLAAMVPYENARVINLSRRQHPTLETVKFDLADESSWDAVGQNFKDTLADFQGKRAIFFHNAYMPGYGFATVADPAAYRAQYIANGLAPLVLGTMFLNAVGEGYESGLVLMSSESSRTPYPGQSAYSAAKAGVEIWVRVVQRELKLLGKKTWVAAVHPGLVDTPTTRDLAKVSGDDFPMGPEIATYLETREHVWTPEEAGKYIWAQLPPQGEDPLVVAHTPAHTRYA
jgi:benzil reductase ((S)-benzoin forming)